MFASHVLPPGVMLQDTWLIIVVQLLAQWSYQMPQRALTSAEVAAELGRSHSWFLNHWRSLVRDKGLPPPLLEGHAPTWSPAQFYAWLDRGLTKQQRAAAAAYRAAFEVVSAPDQSLIDQSISQQTAAGHARYANGNSS